LKLKGHVTLIYVPAPAAARAAINAYLLLRGTVADDEPLFASCDPAGRTAGFLTRTGLYQVVRGLGRQAGITAIVSPHRLLHTASTALAELGVSTDRLQAWGRWEKRETAEVYIDNKPSVAAELAGVVDDMITKLLAEPL
jgi:site-specific recombinase XerD